MPRTTVFSDTAPTPGGPYSHAARSAEGGPLFLAGQVGADPATGQLVDGGAGPQTRQALANLEQVLAAAGRTLADVVKVNIYVASMADFAAVNEAYAAVFEQPYPARTTVAVAGLPLDARVEVECVAG